MLLLSLLLQTRVVSGCAGVSFRVTLVCRDLRAVFEPFLCVPPSPPLLKIDRRYAERLEFCFCDVISLSLQSRRRSSIVWTRALLPFFEFLNALRRAHVPVLSMSELFFINFLFLGRIAEKCEPISWPG